MNLYNSAKTNLRNFIIQATILFMTVLLLIPLSAYADGSGMVDPVYATDDSLFPIIDAADLLTDDQENELATKIRSVESTYESAIVILTVDTTGSRTAEQYADDFYDYNGYGYGENHDGVILLLSMSDRAWHISTTGSAIMAFSDSDIQDIGDAIIEDLGYGDYYQGFDRFVDLCEKELRNEYNSHIFTPGKFAACLVIGLLLALIPLFIFLSQLWTVSKAEGADDYSKNGLQNLRSSDAFIRKTISRTAIPKNDDSSTHTGSSGTSHGGGGGHF